MGGIAVDLDSTPREDKEPTSPLNTPPSDIPTPEPRSDNLSALEGSCFDLNSAADFFVDLRTPRYSQS